MKGTEKDAELSLGIAERRARIHEKVYVPEEITLHAGRILWYLRDSTSPERFQDVPVDLLDTFVNLQNKSDRLIFRFAQKYGPLGLDGQGLPYRLKNGWVDTTTDFPPGIFGEFTMPKLNVETCDHWRRYAKGADAIITAARWLHEDDMDFTVSKLGEFAFDQRFSGFEKVGLQLFWLSPRFADFEVPERYHRATKLQKQRAAMLVIEDEVSRWLKAGGITLLIRHSEKMTGWTLAPGSDAITNLFGVLAVSVARRVVDSAALHICQCGRAFARDGKNKSGRKERAPKSGQRAWCPECKTNGRMWRTYYHEKQERKRDAKET